MSLLEFYCGVAILQITLIVQLSVLVTIDNFKESVENEKNDI